MHHHQQQTNEWESPVFMIVSRPKDINVARALYIYPNNYRYFVLFFAFSFLTLLFMLWKFPQPSMYSTTKFTLLHNILVVCYTKWMYSKKRVYWTLIIDVSEYQSVCMAYISIENIYLYHLYRFLRGKQPAIGRENGWICFMAWFRGQEKK